MFCEQLGRWHCLNSCSPQLLPGPAGPGGPLQRVPCSCWMSAGEMLNRVVADAVGGPFCRAGRAPGSESVSRSRSGTVALCSVLEACPTLGLAAIDFRRLVLCLTQDARLKHQERESMLLFQASQLSFGTIHGSGRAPLASLLLRARTRLHVRSRCSLANRARCLEVPETAVDRCPC